MAVGRALSAGRSGVLQVPGCRRGLYLCQDGALALGQLHRGPENRCHRTPECPAFLALILSLKTALVTRILFWGQEENILLPHSPSEGRNPSPERHKRPEHAAFSPMPWPRQALGPALPTAPVTRPSQLRFNSCCF